MKIVRFVSLVSVAVVLCAAAASGAPRSGLRGVVLLDPAYPVCRVDEPCTKPAAQVRLVFSRRGRPFARTRTSDTGRYRIALAPGTYRVTTPGAFRDLSPRRVVVRRGHVRRVNFTLDVGIR